MAKKIVKSETKSLGELEVAQASYDAKLKQIKKDYRSILKQVRKAETFKEQIPALKSEIAELLRQEGVNPPDKEEIAKKRTQKEMQVLECEAQLGNLVKAIGINLGLKVINEMSGLEADSLKLGKDLKTLPSFIKQRHLREFGTLGEGYLEKFVAQEAWLRRLTGADSKGAAQESKAQFKARIAPFEKEFSLLPNKDRLLPYLVRLENGTLSAFTRLNKQKAEINHLTDLLSKYVERASDERGYRSEIDDPYGKYKDIPFHQLDDSLPKKQGIILAGILRALNQISNREESRSKSVRPESNYKAQVVFLQKVLDSNQSLGAWLRTNLIAEEEKRFRKDNKGYLAAQGNEKLQAKLLSEHMVKFLASPKYNEESLRKNATEEQKAEYLEQKREYALIFKKSFNPFGSTSKEQADTYVLKQVTKLHSAMVAAEDARIVLVEADKQVATVADTTVAKEVRQGEVVAAQTDHKIIEQGSQAKYEPQRFFSNKTSSPSSGPDEELLPSAEIGPQ